MSSVHESEDSLEVTRSIALLINKSTIYIYIYIYIDCPDIVGHCSVIKIVANLSKYNLVQIEISETLWMKARE